MVEATMGFCYLWIYSNWNDYKKGKALGVATFMRNGMKYNANEIGKEQESIVIKLWTGIEIVNHNNLCNRHLRY